MPLRLLLVPGIQSPLKQILLGELYERLGYRDMIQLRRGISRARLTFEGFGSLRDSDFSKRTANRPIKKAHPIYSSSGVQMVIAPHIVHKLQQQGNH